jgi:pimeloyl-ACP methyl ester carboxylesterase
VAGRGPRTVCAPGVDYERRGLAVTEYRPDGPWGRTLVLLSSLGVSRRSWAVPAGLLGQSDRCLAIDLPGHGTSPPAGHFLTISDFADASARLLAQSSTRVLTNTSRFRTVTIDASQWFR